MQKRSAFTLIELMLVVAFFAVLCAILIPSFLRSREKTRAKAQPEATILQEPAPDRPGGLLPVLRLGRVELELSTRVEQVGLDAVRRYDLTHQGSYELEAPAGQLTRLELPFPREASELREASLRFVVDGQSVEPKGASFTLSEAVWVGELPEGLQRVELSYAASGSDCLVYQLPLAARLRSLQVTVKSSDLSQLRVAAWSLRPTLREPDRLVYRLEDLVSRLPIALELTPSPSPLSRVGTLFRLTGLAVLLFGLGLWYLGELYRPGALAHFRLGGFFLLALSYSTFFLIFAVLGFHQDVSTPVAFWVALACWAPPLTLHVAHVVDRDFALRLALPLGLFTLLLVVNGVYGGAWRDYLYLISGVAGVTFLTTTYQGWLRSQTEATARLALSVSEQRERLLACLGFSRQLLDKVALALSQSDPRPLRPARQVVQELARKLAGDLSAPRACDSRDRWLLQTERDNLGRRQENLTLVSEELRLALARLEELRASRPPRPQGQGKCCLACGAASSGGSFCPACGQRMARLLVCDRCHASLLVPAHLIDLKTVKLRCPECGESNLG